MASRPGTTLPTPTAFEVLDASEQASILARLVCEQPELGDDVERFAVEYLSDAEGGFADEVVWALEDLALEDLAGRAGPQPGRGYVHENEAAFELVEDALRPFVDDVVRRARLSMADAACDVALGVLEGLYRCRDPEDGSVLAYAGPDTPADLAHWVVAEAARLGVALSPVATEGVCPEWSGWLETRVS